jgi:hypothetical protein
MGHGRPSLASREFMLNWAIPPHSNAEMGNSPSGRPNLCVKFGQLKFHPSATF